MKNNVKYEIVSVKGVEITVDVSLLGKTEELYFNATEIAKQFNKKSDDFLRLQSTKAYIEEILKESGIGISRLEDLVKIVRGGKYQGTWLHNELAYEFAGWLSATFRRNLHKWVDGRLKEEQHRKSERVDSITGFKPLTEAIQSAHKPPKFYHYSNECNLINRIVTGMDAKAFKQQYGVDSVRDALCARDLRRLNELQSCDAALIKCGFGYDERKALLTRLDTQSLEGVA